MPTAPTAAPSWAADLAGKNVAGRICAKGTRAAALTEAQKRGNREKSRVRSRVEQVFAQMTGGRRALRQRCVGLARNDGGHPAHEPRG